MQYKDDNLLEPLVDDELYAEIYRRYAPALFAYVYQRISAREDAEDIVLDVFLSLLQDRKFPTFEEKKQEAWLWAITRNKTVDYLRRTTRRPQISMEWLAEPLYAGDGYNPEQSSLAREEYLQLARAVQMLPEDQQEVLRLRFGHGLNSEEIGSVIKKNGSAVRMLLSRTLRHLRNHYQDQAKRGQ
jgi:RNA polymerase sigma factor (sigma-70 family)